MKRKLITSIFALLTLISITTVSINASFGTGTSVIARDVTLIKTGICGKQISFTDSDFKSALGVTDFKKITVESLPDKNSGTLIYAGRRMKEGQSIKRRNIPLLAFLPSSADVTEARFIFSMSGVGGGEPIECILRFKPTVNMAPTIEGAGTLSAKTQESVSLFGAFVAKDPEGDALEYMTVSYPKYGSLELKNDGSFVYTPKNGFRGKDEFSCIVRDEWGNWSEAKSIAVKVEKRASETVFYDMKERREYGAALIMDSLGAMGGTVQNGVLCFMPDEKMTRAEFLRAAMLSAGMLPEHQSVSFFDDDCDIPDELRPFVASAARHGVVNGEFDRGGLYFRPNEQVTVYEAAKIAATLAHLDKSGEASEYLDFGDAPVWARDALFAMYTLGIIEPDSQRVTDTLTRAEAAVFLAKLSAIL